MLRSQLLTAEVEHRHWDLHRARALEFEENLRHAAALEFPSADFLSHYSPGVDTKIGPPQRIGRFEIGVD